MVVITNSHAVIWSRNCSCPLTNSFLAPKWHFDRFSRFLQNSRMLLTDRHTHRHTDRPRYCVCSSSPSYAMHPMWPNDDNNNSTNNNNSKLCKLYYQLIRSNSRHHS